MDCEIFIKWFHITFVPQDQAHLKNLGSNKRTVPLLDNAPCHPAETIWKSDDGMTFIGNLPSNVTVMIKVCVT